MDKEQSKAEGRRHKGRKTMVNRQSKIVNFFMGLFLLFPFSAHAGSLDSSAAPTDAGSAMYTLSDIYNRLNAGTAGTKRSGAFTEPSAGPAATGKTLDDVMGKVPTADNTDGAVTGEVANGKTFWGLRTDGTWGLQTGTIATQSLSPANDTVAAGIYTATTLSAVDTDLATGNIKSGVTIFGIAGITNVVDTTTGDATATDIANGKKAWVDGSEITGTGYSAPVEKTGQTTSYDGSNLDDGGLQKGVSWPNPRFTASNGTVTDNLTGLIWLKNADCATATRNWATAITDVESLNSAGTINGNDCTDISNGGSYQTDWRLPNVKELSSLIDFAFTSPALSDAAGTAQWTSGDAFTGVQANGYWSSTTYSASTTDAWGVVLASGGVDGNGRAVTFYVWPVRGGQ